MNNSQIIRTTQRKALAKFKAYNKRKAKAKQDDKHQSTNRAESLEAYKIAAVMYDKQQHYNNDKHTYYKENTKHNKHK